MIQVNEQVGFLGGVYQTKPTINRDSLNSLLTSQLKDFTLEDLVGALTNKYVEIIEYIDLCHGQRACQKTSLLFNPHRLDTRTSSSKLSIFEAFKTESFISGLARATIFRKSEKVSTAKLLYYTLQLGINGVQYVNEFPPHVARELAIFHRLSKESKILDPCAGWGGRMIGFSTVVGTYHCYEPSTKTYQGLCKLYEFLKAFQSDFVTVINNKPFEDGRIRENYYDFAMTSPPYYDSEIYSSESTNSLNKYQTFQEWCESFYIPMISRTLKAIKPGSSFVLNIGSRKYPLNTVLFDNFSKDYKITKLRNYLSNTVGALGKKGEGETFYQITK